MFTDIVGYTALMSQDEDRTIEIVKRSRALHTSIVAEHEGDILDVVGDGTLCCFQSALDAVRCAVAIQNEAADVPGLNLRVGIHLGDVVFSDDHVFGDGVNVASRIQAAADPGAIHVSEQVYLQVKNHPEISVGFVGMKHFKNVPDPMRIYWVGSRTRASPVVSPTTPSRRESTEKTIAVLPFDDMSPDRDNEYFSDGLTEEIIADLSLIKSLRVISRTSTMMLKGTDKDLRTIARELGVRYVLEGSVRKAGDRLRITAQLIDGTTDTHLWAEKYRGSIEDVFEIQEHVSQAIVAALKVGLSLEEQTAIEKRQVTDLHAHECLFRARHEMWKTTEESIARALEFLEEAHETAKDAVEIHSAMVEAYFLRFHVTGVDLEETVQKMAALADEILQLDPDSSYGHLCRGLVQSKSPGGIHEAVRSFRRAAEMNPTDSAILLMQTVSAIITGNLDLALDASNRVVRLDPISPANRIMRALVLVMAGQSDVALNEIEWLLKSDGPSSFLWGTVTVLANLGRFEDVVRVAGTIPTDASDNIARIGLLYAAAVQKRSSDFGDFITPELEATASRDETFSWSLAQCHALVGQKDEAIRWLETSVSYGFINYPWFSERDLLLENVRGEPRFQALMEHTKREYEHHVALFGGRATADR
jgi:TolB-like protein